ncbi:MAG: hypothetical protein QM754_08790 [Tepidisphaeraceae bacterium]
MQAEAIRRAPPGEPTTRVTVVSTTEPASQPAEPVSVTFKINGQDFTFPAAKLVTKANDDGVRVTLFSDDPPEAVRDGYQGNSFYFRFQLGDDAAADIAGQQFAFRNSFSEQDETSSGLFIAGGRQTLRPASATVTIERVEQQIVVQVAGTFRLFDDQAADNTPASVRVSGYMEPTVIDAKKK